MADHERRVYTSIVEMLSNEENPTPMVRLNKTVPYRETRVYAKLEWYNPFGSVKDRIAANMIRDAEARGLLAEGQKLVEPTSGNTGLALAMIANSKGYSLRTPLSSAIPVEKRTILRLFGAEVEELNDTLCPAPGAPEGAIARAVETAGRPGFHMLNQYENLANVEAHMRTTGPEVWRQTGGKITHFVAGLGTCGTITGNGRFLKSKNPDVKVIGVHPEEGHDIPGVRSIRQLEQTKLFFPEEYDRLVEISNRRAFDLCVRLNREDSIMAGPSSALALAGALDVIDDAPDALVVIIFPDNVFKYASSLARHFPEVTATASSGAGSAAPSAKEELLDSMVANSRNPHDTCEVEDVQEMLEDRRPFLLDVRPPNVYQKGHVSGARNIPVHEIANRAAELPEDRDAPMVTVCERGNASIHGLLVLKSLGYRNVKSMNGGTRAWIDKGLPIE